MNRKFNIHATLATISALLLWSLGPIFVKFLTNYLDMWTQNLLRYSAACIFWLPFLVFSIRSKKLDPSVWRKAIVPSISNIILQSLWAGAFYYLDPAFVVLLVKSSVIWIVGFSMVFFVEERVLLKSKLFWTGMLFSVVGVIGVLCFKQGFATEKTLTGILIALLMAFFWGVYIISAKIAFKDIDSRNSFSVVTIYTVAGFCILTSLFGNPAACLEMPAWPWVCIIISAILCIAIAHVLYYSAMKRIGATIPALILLAQPFLVLAISSVLFDESLNSLQWIFGIVLLAGCALAIWSQKNLR